MGELIERMARAMCAADGVNPDWPVYRGEPCRVPGGYISPSGDGVPAWQLYVYKATLALRAALEPTATMLTAGKHAVKGCDSTYERDIAETAWRAMIQAELKEP